ncbi:MAG TPA: NmrA family NAD(P)-binding protein [Methanobacteriaceae archaeon]|nr:NmrA family NAD(P)-binding protein [Methanobacteriaceae archaeon]
MNILITGATGNVGREVINCLFNLNTPNQVFAGVRNVERAKNQFSDFSNLKYVEFDFENPETFESALNDMDLIFLLRPPHISDIKGVFNPLIDSIKAQGINKIVFLSVQGAEKSKIIPHHKIEQLILDNNIKHVFLRPGYFMQNLTTTLLDDIKTENKIYLPAGKAKFNWIDVKNIAEVSAIILNDFDGYQDQILEITGYENKDFQEVAQELSQVLGREIEFENPNLLMFYLAKKKQGTERGLILVMIMLHFLPRFQKDPHISNFYEELTGKEPNTLMDFIKREKDVF